MSIIIACVGLYAVSYHTIIQSTKEVGIRKVNGAKIFDVIKLLNINFVRWIFVAFVVAVPITCWTMHMWLLNFAYKTEMNWWIFVLTGILTFGIALLTVSWQSWRAATRNPIEALRYE